MAGSRGRMNRWRGALLTVLAAASALAGATDRTVESAKVTLQPPAWPIDSFELIDHEGEVFNLDALQRRWTFVVFGSTACGAPCEHALSTLASLRGTIDKFRVARHTQVVLVSLDPQVDTRERLRRHLLRFDSSFVGASGKPADIDTLAHALNAPRRVGDAAGGWLAGAAIHLVDPEQRLWADFHPPFDVKSLTAAYLKMRTCWPHALAADGRCDRR